MRIIKKYKNRLMYDTGTSRMITLRQLADMLRENINLRIEDNESGKDITRMTLLQMLLDMEKSGRSVRALLPDLMAWVFKPPRFDLKKALREMLLKNAKSIDLGRSWARKLVQETSLAKAITPEEQDVIAEEIAQRLGDLFESILGLLDQTVLERSKIFEKIFSFAADTTEIQKQFKKGGEEQ